MFVSKIISAVGKKIEISKTKIEQRAVQAIKQRSRNIRKTEEFSAIFEGRH